MEPIIEAYIGEYASGKSENALNRAIRLAQEGRKVTLVDLDLVEPFYTLRPIKGQLEEYGIDVVAWETKDTLGLGEAGSVIRPDMRWVLRRPGDIIMDIGYGIEGAKTLNLIEGAKDNPYLKVIAVINASRPMTNTVDDIIEHIDYLGRVDAIINNTHLGDDTDIEVIKLGVETVQQAADQAGVPLIGTAIDEKFIDSFPEKKDQFGHPVLPLKRFMHKAFW